jgi:hypothetical protein
MGALSRLPMIFIAGLAENPLVQTSFTGQGVAAYDGKWQTFMPAVPEVIYERKINIHPRLFDPNVDRASQKWLLPRLYY